MVCLIRHSFKFLFRLSDMRRAFFFLAFLLAFSLFFIPLGFALHVVQSLAGGTSLGSFNEDISALYNFSIQNGDVALSANISQVNISFPASFSYMEQTAGASFSSYSFVTSSQTLSFSNITGLISAGTTQYLWFNLTAQTPGGFNFTISTTNASGTFYHNLSVLVNDTTAPLLSFASPGYTTAINLTGASIAINTSASDNSALDSITITLMSSSSSILNTSLGIAVPSHFFNFTGLDEGIYYLNISSNDSSNNINASVPLLRIALDRTPPSVSLDEETSNRTALNISISISDGVTGVSGTCTLESGGGSINGSGPTQYLFRNGLECGTTYRFNVSCIDHVSYRTYASDSFETDGCASSSSSTGGSGNGDSSSSSYWKSTKSVSSSQLESGYAALLELRDRIRVVVDGLDYYFGIVDIDANSISLNLSSSSDLSSIDVNETRLFEVTGDGYYDVSFSVNEINDSTTGVNVTLRGIHELTPESARALGISSNESADLGNRARLGALFSGASWWIWIVISLVLVAFVLLLWKWYVKSQRLQGLTH